MFKIINYRFTFLHCELNRAEYTGIPGVKTLHFPISTKFETSRVGNCRKNLIKKFGIELTAVEVETFA